MKNGWLERLREAIEADGRSYNKISEDAGLGRNFIQQMVKYGKAPGADKLAAILEALGSDSALYVMTGIRADQWDMEMLRAASALDDDAREDVLSLMRRLAGQQSEPKPDAG